MAWTTSVRGQKIRSKCNNPGQSNTVIQTGGPEGGNLKKSKGVNPKVWKKCLLGRGESKYKSLKQKMLGLRKRKQANVVRTV